MSDPIAGRLRERFEAADVDFRGRAPRERLLVAGMLIAATVYVADGLALRPLEQARKHGELALAASEARIHELEARIDAIRNPVLDDAERARREEIRQLELQLGKIDDGISRAVSRLVPPESAVEILEALLAHDGRLELVNLTSQPPRRLDPEQTQGTQTLYHHGLTLELQGDFAATLDYLRRIEASPWQILWDRFEYRVDGFPDAHVTIELHTLSEREEWVGV